MRVPSYLLLIGLLMMQLSCRPVLIQSINEKNGGVVVHLETLGEYPTTVKRLEIHDLEFDQVVWRVTYPGDGEQLWRLELRSGLNSAIPGPMLNERAKVIVETPEDSGQFFLNSGKSYRLVVQGKSGTDEAEFVMP